MKAFERLDEREAKGKPPPSPPSPPSPSPPSPPPTTTTTTTPPLPPPPPPLHAQYLVGCYSLKTVDKVIVVILEVNFSPDR